MSILNIDGVSKSFDGFRAIIPGNIAAILSAFALVGLLASRGETGSDHVDGQETPE